MTVAKQLEIDLIVLAQMNRVGMDACRQEGRAPTLDQIRGTDALSHVSHAVWIAPQAWNDDHPARKAKRGLGAVARQDSWPPSLLGRSGQCRVGLFPKSILQMDYALQRCQAR